MFKNLDGIGKFLYIGTIVPLFLSLIAPVLVNSSFLFPFITTKTLFFRIAIEVALFFYILLALHREEFRPKFSPLGWSVVIFASIITLASLLGVNWYKSFWGNIERGEGLLTVYHVFALFIIATQTIKSAKLWKGFIHVAILVSVGTAFYALFQKLNVDWKWIIHSGENRLSSTVGNAAFYAGYLLFGIFLSAWLFVKEKLLPMRIVYAAVILFELYILLETRTRGAFIGLVGAMVLITIIYLVLSKSALQRKVAGGILGVLILSGVLVGANCDTIMLSQKVQILRRVCSISFNDITTQSRLLTWDSSWQGLKERPVLGYGWENYNIAFNKHFHPEIFRDAGSQIWFDRAHNIVFDVAVNSGFVGLIAYLAIFVLAVRALYRVYKKTKDLPTFAFLVSLLAAYFVQNIFVFDVLATYISFYVVLALIVYLEKEHTGVWGLFDRLNLGRFKQIMSSTKTFGYPIIAAFLVIGLIASIYSFNVKPARANMIGIQALIASAQNQKADAVDLFHEAIALDTYQSAEIRQKYAEMVIELVRSGNTNTSFVSSQFDEVINEIKENIKREPSNVQHYLFLMILYNQSDQFNAHRLDLLFDKAVEALELSPTRPQIYFEIGQAHLSRKEFDQGIEAFQTALELQPLAIESRWNLAAAYAIAGRQEEAEKEFAYLSEHGFDYYSVSNLRRMIPVYSQAENWEKLLDVYKRLSDMDPNNADLHARLAATYQRLGRFDEARASVERVLELDPSIAAEAEQFLKQIDAQQQLQQSPQAPSQESVLKGE